MATEVNGKRRRTGAPGGERGPGTDRSEPGAPSASADPAATRTSLVNLLGAPLRHRWARLAPIELDADFVGTVARQVAEWRLDEIAARLARLEEASSLAGCEAYGEDEDTGGFEPDFTEYSALCHRPRKRHPARALPPERAQRYLRAFDYRPVVDVDGADE
jgi:hypothetical protein